MILKAHEISKSYKGKKVVNKVSVKVSQGEIVGLLGPNGAGKTTSFYMIVGIIKPEEGEIYLDNEKISTYPMYKRAQSGIGYLAQEASVFRKLSEKSTWSWRRFHDFDDLRPNGVTNHYSRIFTPNSEAVSNETFLAGTTKISEGVIDAVKSIMTCSPDYLVMGMSAITFYDGLKGADEF